MVGKLARVAIDRTVGTILGGTSGFGAYVGYKCVYAFSDLHMVCFWHSVLNKTCLTWTLSVNFCCRCLFGDNQNTLLYFVLALTLFVSAVVSTVVAWRVARLDTTPKLFTYTFLLVAFGAQTITGAIASSVSDMHFTGASFNGQLDLCCDKSKRV